MCSEPAPVRKHPLIVFAAAIIKAVKLSNHTRFFELYRGAPGMAGYLLDFMVFRIRNKMYEQMLTAFGPTLTVSSVKNGMGFKSKKECSVCPLVMFY